MTRVTRPLIYACLALAAAGCSNDSSPTAATPTVTTAFTFATSFTTQGSAARSFETFATGAIALTLSSTSPDLPLGIGVGIPRPDGAGCNLTRAAEVRVGGAPQIVVTAEPGVWCVKVYDPGVVTERVTFALEVSHF